MKTRAEEEAKFFSLLLNSNTGTLYCSIKRPFNLMLLLSVLFPLKIANSG
jgi:hypothetical protein